MQNILQIQHNVHYLLAYKDRNTYCYLLGVCKEGTCFTVVFKSFVTLVWEGIRTESFCLLRKEQFFLQLLLKYTELVNINI